MAQRGGNYKEDLLVNSAVQSNVETRIGSFGVGFPATKLQFVYPLLEQNTIALLEVLLPSVIAADRPHLYSNH
jgi:hypothetical protein